MTVGQQVSVGREQKARTAAPFSTTIARSPPRTPGHFDEGDGRGDAFQGADDRAGIGVEQWPVIVLRSVVLRAIVLGGVVTGPCPRVAVTGDPLRRQRVPLRCRHVQLRIIFGCADNPSTMSRFTRRTKIAGSSNSPPSASIAWSYSTCARSENEASSAVFLRRSTRGCFGFTSRTGSVAKGLFCPACFKMRPMRKLMPNSPATN